MAIVLCMIVMLVLQVATPYWWWIMVVPLGYAVIASQSGWQGFRTGLLSAGLLWLLMGFYAFATTSDIVASRVAAMLRLGDAGWLALLVTAVVAGLAGGLAGATGAALKAGFSTKK